MRVCGHSHLATRTGLEPATSAVTGRRANQLRYRALKNENISGSYVTLKPFAELIRPCVPPTGFEPVLPP